MTETYRVYESDRGDDELTLVDPADGTPAYVSTAGYEGDLADRVAGLRPGYLVRASLDWEAETARFDALDVERRTLFAFRRGVTNLFEDALDAWAEAEREGLGVNSRTTYSNDGEPNGALYTFAEQPGARDVFEEFRTGARPLDPLLEQVNENAAAAPREVFVFDPQTHRFVLVYIVLGKESVLADTVRDTYDCPRPDEPTA